VACDGCGNEEIPYLLRVSVPAGISDGQKLRMRIRTPSGLSQRVEVRISVS
jgi:hypothetical protein